MGLRPAAGLGDDVAVVPLCRWQMRSFRGSNLGESNSEIRSNYHLCTIIPETDIVHTR